MIRKSRFATVISSLLMLLAVLVVTSSHAQAQVTKPFKIVGLGIAPEGLPLPGQAARPHWIVGEATHLGRHTGEGTLSTDSAVPQPNGTITGEFGSVDPFVFTAANGDKLVCNFGRTAHGAAQPGSFTLTVVGFTEEGAFIVTADFIAEFVASPEDSTGRFAGVTGSWIMYASTEAFVLGSTDPIIYGWDGRGSLTFQK